MKRLLQSEEIVLFAACLYYFTGTGLSWWLFAAFILLPDLSMLGYLINARAGAVSYNFWHHRGIAAMVFIVGILYHSTWIEFAGFILFAHATMDRMFGYGLKYEKGFRFTHLGTIGHDNVENPVTPS
jgi:hypothetical protein